MTRLVTKAGKRPTYPAYKPSGIEWLGQIPEHWEPWKVTHGFRYLGSGTTPKSDDLKYYGGYIPWVTTSELRENVIVDTTNKLSDDALRDYPNLLLVITAFTDRKNTQRLSLRGVEGQRSDDNFQPCHTRGSRYLPPDSIEDGEFAYV